MKLNFEFIFLVAIAHRGTFLKPFNFFRIFVVVVVLFVSLNMRTCSSVCLLVWFVWLLFFPFAVPLSS